ncbi:hypothetical protein Nhal_0869 [Nitrosococcus halophilus Nc 4]|uniref:Lipocalin-like domain-containing protein n=2 Tax=Nitrosococcus halophilus TaxID=133539 RepID=D5BY62_NITHN|nr:hypothetical protein Nhal_0869 [Nitrosococcus halophilus Nc 4]
MAAVSPLLGEILSLPDSNLGHYILLGLFIETKGYRFSKHKMTSDLRENIMSSRSILGLAFLFLSYAFLGATVYAQSAVKEPSDIVGTWEMEKTAQRQDGSNSNKEFATWDFHSDGKVEISGYNKFLKQKTTFNKTYKIIEESVIKVKDDLGTTKYKVVEKSNGRMILKGPYGYHFFKRK